MYCVGQYKRPDLLKLAFSFLQGVHEVFDDLVL